MGAGILQILDRGGGNAQVIEHAGARLSWQVDGPGRFVAEIPSKVARAYGASGGNWSGAKWIRFQHPDLPDWGGVVTMPQWRPGTLSLNCESFHVLFRKRRVPRDYGQQSAPAGALARRAFGDVQSDDYTFIREFVADEDGDPIDWQWRGGDLLDDVLRQLMQASNHEFDVDADRNAQWRVRLGSDKSGSVLLSHPNEVVDYNYSIDLWTCQNDIVGVAADQRYAASAYDQLDDDRSVATRGRYQSTIRYPHVVTKGTIRPKLKRDLEKFAEPAQVLTLTTVNIAHVWSRYQHGDTVKLFLPDSDSRLNVRIGARSIDVDQQTEQLACEVV